MLYFCLFETHRYSSQLITSQPVLQQSLFHLFTIYAKQLDSWAHGLGSPATELIGESHCSLYSTAFSISSFFWEEIVALSLCYSFGFKAFSCLSGALWVCDFTVTCDLRCFDLKLRHNSLITCRLLFLQIWLYMSFIRK